MRKAVAEYEPKGPYETVILRSRSVGTQIWFYPKKT